MIKRLLILSFVWGIAEAGEPLRTVELEGGWLSTGRADVRIPGDTGTRFSLVNNLSAETTEYVRMRVSWRSAPRHNWLLSVVPIEVSASGTLDEDTQYVDTLFPAGAEVDATYRFNNYRLTYRYLLRKTGRFRAEIGATLFVRDAKISLRSAANEDASSDLGIVPLVSFASSWQLLPGVEFVIDGDALAAPQGRAFDIFAGLHYRPRDHVLLGAGYRILEGGADNDDVYTFALFHHAALQAVLLF